jgi:hypothetical protein
MKFPKLIVSVAEGDSTDIRVFRVDGRSGKQKELKAVMDYTVVFEQRRTGRCQVCDKTYPLSEIVHTGEEVLCKSCVVDKYPIQPEDIPY